jgi:hypothetical protein
MIDRRDDKAGVGEHFTGVVMAGEAAGPAVRDHDQRQFPVGQWAILHPRQ